ncbi:STAS/SEC14 domain-containing protein [Hymenobacter volaticus]|uniref:STAS/SEC14 domain-containing protein n=1 Tax=Hymenobacter volaticus TaxID=2932254 RepID=A0ABY4GFH4_9BACT|nr:STAS/SEC14 domain-containing protein [Hymenobacter volaticus]UOQ69526.1 STAS/SEC14 domain-containing protein [Hymenobacter volaticus]
MHTELRNASGRVYLTIKYDLDNQWVYNNWLGPQTYVGILAGANECLHPLWENACPYLLNDNRLVVGQWSHVLEWLVRDWAPRAIAQGLTHFAHVVSADALAAHSAQALHLQIGKRFHMRLFDELEPAQAWLRAAQWQAR